VVEAEPAKPLIGLLLRLAAQQWGTAMDAALRAEGVEGITPAHANVIPFVPPEGIQIGRLVATGYVARGPDPRDRRASLIFLTDKGRALGPASRSAGNRVERDWATVVGRDEIEHLRQTLTRLLQSEPPDHLRATYR
jgi:hypothetical protein